MQNVPEFIYRSSSWFLYLSNALEMDRIKSETAQRAAGAENVQLQKRNFNNIMQRRSNIRRR
jgi:hypothetical protein